MVKCLCILGHTKSLLKFDHTEALENDILYLWVVQVTAPRATYSSMFNINKHGRREGGEGGEKKSVFFIAKIQKKRKKSASIKIEWILWFLSQHQYCKSWSLVFRKLKPFGRRVLLHLAHQQQTVCVGQPKTTTYIGMS